MNTRGALCIGVNRTGSLSPLQAAAQGAVDFEFWASSQGFVTKLLTDKDNKKVFLSNIFEAIDDFVQAGTYEQLIIYFSGHGILTAPGSEYWLLSGAPQNPNEAVNLARSVEDARNCGIPHIIFISDACRSAVQGPPLSGIMGGIIFPNSTFHPQSGEIDVFYAARPGDPAYEVPELEAVQRYKGIFTNSLLKAVKYPVTGLIEDASSRKVVTSRGLKRYLEANMPIEAGDINVQIRQKPDVRVESALPKYFSVAPLQTATSGPLTGLKGMHPDLQMDYYNLSDELEFKEREKETTAIEVNKLLSNSGREQFETHTGFTVIGGQVINAYTSSDWRVEIFSDDKPEKGTHIRLTAWSDYQDKAYSILIQFINGTGVLLGIIPEYIGTVLIEKERIININYVPSQNSWRYSEYEYRATELERMKAEASVATRDGQFMIMREQAEAFADKIRQVKSIDPIMGVFAAYSYAQSGRFEDVFSVFKYMHFDGPHPVPFDVYMLAYNKRSVSRLPAGVKFAPFVPILSQGWSLLLPDHPLYKSIHSQLRPHVIPALWTTFSETGVRLLREFGQFENINIY